MSASYVDQQPGQEDLSNWEGQHRNNISNAFKQQYGRLPTVAEREQLASYSGDIGQVKGLLGSTPNASDLYRNITLSPQAQQQRDTLANAAYQPQVDIANQSLGRLRSALQSSQTDAQNNLLEHQNQLGLLHSGNTSAGLERLYSDTASKQQDAASSNANQIAQLALQRTGYSQNLLNNQLTQANSMQQLGLGQNQLDLQKTNQAQSFLTSPLFASLPAGVAQELLAQYGINVQG